jgi:hypothetical protein
VASTDFQESKLSTHDVIDQIAEIAGIPIEHREFFRCKIDSIIRNATDFHESRTRVASKRIAGRLAGIAKAAERLQNELKKTEWPGMAILDCGLNETGRTSYESLVENLELLGRATQWSIAVAKRPAHRPAGIMTVFDVLVFQLLIAAHISGGKNKLTIYKSEHSESGWDGRLLRAVGLLRPMLPQGLVPKGHLGNSLERIAELFEAAISKHFSGL